MKRNVEERKILNDIQRELANLKSSTVGWTKVDYKHGYRDRYHAIDIELWVEENCGDYKKFGTTFYFREAHHASMFIMRWL